jgi:hypothetical protein
VALSPLYAVAALWLGKFTCSLYCCARSSVRGGELRRGRSLHPSTFTTTSAAAAAAAATRATVPTFAATSAASAAAAAAETEAQLQVDRRAIGECGALHVYVPSAVAEAQLQPL